MKDLANSSEIVTEDGKWWIEYSFDNTYQFVDIYFQPTKPVEYITLEHIIDDFPVKYTCCFKEIK